MIRGQRPHPHRDLHALGTRVEGGNFALISQGFPQLVRVELGRRGAPTTARVSRAHTHHLPDPHGQRDPLVPDLERLEEMIAEETSISA